MNATPSPAVPGPPSHSSRPFRRPSRPWLWIALGAFALLMIGGAVLYNYYFHAHIRPTKLNDKEWTALNHKLEALQTASETAARGSAPGSAYAAAKGKDDRLLVLTQRELNGILNHNTDLGDYLKIQLLPGALDVTVAIPVPDDLPLFGGMTLRCGLDLALSKQTGGDLQLAVRNFSFFGIPLPSAWLEAIGIFRGENVLLDLDRDGTGFADFERGIESLELSRGELRILLAH